MKFTNSALKVLIIIFLIKALYSFGGLNYLLNILRETVHPDIYGVSFYGIAKMTQYGPAASELTQENPMTNLLSKCPLIYQLRVPTFSFFLLVVLSKKVIL